MLKKLSILIVLLISITSSPVLAKHTDIVILNDVEPLKTDSSYKQAKLIQENGKILKREKPKVEVDLTLNTKNVKIDNLKTKPVTEQNKIAPELKPVTDKPTENEPKIAPAETKITTVKPEGITIIPENGITSASDQTKSLPPITPSVKPEVQKVQNPKLSVDEVKELIAKYSEKYDTDVETMFKIANCESGFKTDLIGSGKYFGVFQFSKPTFYEFAPKLNFQNPDPLNPDQNIELAAYMMSEGQAWRWGCK